MKKITKSIYFFINKSFIIMLGIIKGSYGTTKRLETCGDVGHFRC
jgi:hypothetical protein